MPNAPREGGNYGDEPEMQSYRLDEGIQALATWLDIDSAQVLEALKLDATRDAYRLTCEKSGRCYRDPVEIQFGADNSGIDYGADGACLRVDFIDSEGLYIYAKTFGITKGRVASIPAHPLL